MYAVRRQTLSNITSKQEFTDGFKKGNENTTGGNESMYPNDTERRERYSPYSCTWTTAKDIAVVMAFTIQKRALKQP